MGMGGYGRDRRPMWAPSARLLVLLLVGAAVAASIGAAWSVRLKGEHTATAVIMLHPLTGNAYSPGGRGDDLVNLETEAQVLRSEAVARSVLDRLGGQGDSVALLAAVRVRVPPNTQLLEITTRGVDDAAALARVSAFAEVYLAFRRARTESAVFEQTSRLNELVDARGDERTAAISKLERLAAGSSQRPVLEQQIEELTLQISSLRAQLVTAESESLDPGQVVTPGRVAPQGLLAEPPVVAAAAAIAVLLAAAMCLVLRAGRSRTFAVRSLDDVADLAPPGLGAVRTPVRDDSEVVAVIRSAVLGLAPARPRVVALARADRATSVLHAPLVAALGNARYQVASVDLGRPEDVAAVEQLVLEEVEVDDVLAEQHQFVAHLQPTRMVRRTESELADLVTAAGMARSLGDLAKRADLVVVRCPGLASPAGRALLAAVSAVVVEVSPGHTTRDDLERALDEAGRAGCDVLGMVEVRPGRARTKDGALDDAEH